MSLALHVIGAVSGCLIYIAVVCLFSRAFFGPIDIDGQRRDDEEPRS